MAFLVKLTTSIQLPKNNHRYALYTEEYLMGDNPVGYFYTTKRACSKFATRDDAIEARDRYYKDECGFEIIEEYNEKNSK